MKVSDSSYPRLAARIPFSLNSFEIQGSDKSFAENLSQPLFSVADIAVSLNKGGSSETVNLNHQINITVNAKSLFIHIFYALEISNIIENAVNLQKGCKYLAQQHSSALEQLESVPSPTIIEPESVPHVALDVENISVQFDDSPFEANLRLNYHDGFDEQMKRIKRYKAFAKKAAALQLNPSNFNRQDLETAWWKLQEFNSNLWIKGVKSDIHNRCRQTSLVMFTLENLRLVLSKPILPKSTVADSINAIDYQTPANIKYTLLFPASISISFSRVSIRLRDYPVEFLSIANTIAETDNSKRDVIWNSKGLLIVAEVTAGDESQRVISMSSYEDNIGISFSRTINPPKFYLQTHTNIFSQTAINFTWGVAMEGAVADMVRAIDSFTKPNIDPSVPVGWWDKVRILLHGENTIQTSESSSFCFQMLGSFTPYYHPAKHFGSEGFNIILTKGLFIQLGGEQNDSLKSVIQCGELCLCAPLHTVSTSQTSEIQETIFRLSGGVEVRILLKFLVYEMSKAGMIGLREIEPWKRHSSITLRAPRFCKKATEDKFEDSYEGFRTSSIHIDAQILSSQLDDYRTNPFTSSLFLTPDSLDRFRRITPLFQSPLTALPIRHGKLFINEPILHKKPKLSRSIGYLKFKFQVQPLLLGLIHELEEGDGGVGIRCRADKIDASLLLTQRTVQSIMLDYGFKEFGLNPDLALDVSIPRSTKRWRFESSKILFSQVEARTVTFGAANRLIEVDSYDQDVGSNVDHVNLAEEFEQTKQIWTTSDDYKWVSSPLYELLMIPFCWSPHIVYTKNNKNISSGEETIFQSDADQHNIQMGFLSERLSEVQRLIDYYKEIQKAFEYRMTIFFDDSMKQFAELMKEKLSVLFEKKIIIEKHMRELESFVQTPQSGRTFSAFTRDTQKFDHTYIIHNIQFLWKTSVRNTIFKFIDLQSKDFAVRYFTSNSSTRMLRDLIVSLEASQKPISQNAPSRQEALNKRPANLSKAPSGIDPGLQLSTQSIAQSLLDKLVSELGNDINVPNETMVANNDSNAGSGLKAPQTMINDTKLIDNLPSGSSIENNFVIELINPQVSLQWEEMGQVQSVLVVAKKMQIQSLEIVDNTIIYRQQILEDDLLKRERVIKSRSVLSISKAQLFIARKSDIDNGDESDINHFLLHNLKERSMFSSYFGENNIQISDYQSAWPVWVPLECFIDHLSHHGHLQQVVEETNASLYHDKINPLFIERMQNSRAEHSNIDSLTDSYYASFPNFSISANSNQYSIIVDVISNLLIYSDPTQGERNEKLRKMKLALDQMIDVKKVLDTIALLQEKIRYVDLLLRNEFSDEPTYLQLKKCIIQFHDELYITMAALKQICMTNHNVNSENADTDKQLSQVNIKAGTLVWIMVLDSGDPLCRISLNNIQFVNIHYQNQSSLKTVNVDLLSVENLWNASISFPNLISSYNLANSDLDPIQRGRNRRNDFNKHKMLRIIWREMAAVAGIQVVDHFEVNIAPLLFQMTYEIGKHMMKYLFPEKQKYGSENTHQNANLGTERSKNMLSTTGTGEFSTKMVSKVGRNAGGSTFSQAGDKRDAISGKTSDSANELLQMQSRALQNKSFIYIKVPGVEHCLSYKGLKDKNFEDLHNFSFKMPTLEYRNKTWTWYDFLNQVKRDAVKAVLANSGALIREKLMSHGKKGHTNISSSGNTSD
ncbi:golgi-body localization protein domain-containing protein [Cladochytrium replicatum]|nr:golgi-body localization protein domain-containing protein [Cladochytrium replicatum]